LICSRFPRVGKLARALQVPGYPNSIPGSPKELEMTNLTYEAYLRNPNAREVIEEEVRRLRDEAVDRYIAEPVKRAFRRLLHVTRSIGRPTMSPRSSVSSAT
jgi:hypothetical protein